MTKPENSFLKSHIKCKIHLATLIRIFYTCHILRYSHVCFINLVPFFKNSGLKFSLKIGPWNVQKMHCYLTAKPMANDDI